MNFINATKNAVSKLSTFTKVALISVALIAASLASQGDFTPTPPTAAEVAAATKDRADMHKAYMARDLIKASLRNPDSLKVTKGIVTDDGVVCLEYRAQNGFGGMNAEFAVMDAKLVMHQTDAAWNKLCAGKSGSKYF